MKQILNLGIFYNLYQSLIGSGAWLKRYAQTFIIPKIKHNSASILDFGCGTGSILKALPDNIKYTGIDYQQNYIDFCLKKHPGHEFICRSASGDINLNKTFDIIISEALISNFNNEEVKKVFINILKHSNKDTKIIISEMNYKPDNSKIENFLLSHERGSTLRGKEDYKKIFSGFFNIENITEINNAYRIPYQKIVFELTPAL